MKPILPPFDFTFEAKPLLVGGKAMELYDLRPAGDDIDFIISALDYTRLAQRYPGHIREIEGDLGICLGEYEFWRSICAYDYAALSPQSADLGDVLLIEILDLHQMKAHCLQGAKHQRDAALLAGAIKRQRLAQA